MRGWPPGWWPAGWGEAGRQPKGCRPAGLQSGRSPGLRAGGTPCPTPPRPPPAPRDLQSLISWLNLRGRGGRLPMRAFAAARLGRMAPDGIPGTPGTPGLLMHVRIESNGGTPMTTGAVDAGATATPRAPDPGALKPVACDGRAWWDPSAAAGCTDVTPPTRPLPYPRDDPAVRAGAGPVFPFSPRVSIKPRVPGRAAADRPSNTPAAPARPACRAARCGRAASRARWRQGAAAASPRPSPLTPAPPRA